MRALLLSLVLAAAPLSASVPGAAAEDPHRHHGDGQAGELHHDHADGHAMDVGPAGRTYDLRWLDAMVQHHTGALRMSELMFGIGEPGVGALARSIWNEQAREIRAMGLWRRAWFPQAALPPLMLRPGGDPDAMADLMPMDRARIEAMRMMAAPPTPATRVRWFLEGMLQHHGGALQMAHDALRRSGNPTIRRLARQIIVEQRREIIALRHMLQRDGLRRPEYHRFDSLFAL